MISRQRLAMISFILLLSLLLAACVRPVPGAEDGGGELTPAAVEQSNAGSGYPAPAVPAQSDPPADYPYPGAADTPRLELGSSDAYPGTEDSIAGSDGQPLDETPIEEPAADAAETDAATTDTEAITEDSSTTETDVPTEESSSDETAVAEEPPPPYIEHVVQPSQTLYSIGLVYGFSWVVLAQYNDIANPDALSPGDIVRIPTLAEIEAFYAAEAEPETAAAETETGTAVTEVTEYVVQADDNLYSIALQFGLSWVDIAQANGLTDAAQIEAGQILIIPAAPAGE